MSSLERKKIATNVTYDEKTSSSLQLLLKKISSVNRAVELQTVLKESIEVVQNVMNSEASSLMLLDENTGDLIVSMPTGPVREEVKGKRIEQGQGIGGWVVKHDKPYYSNNLAENDLFAGDISDNFTSKNIICVPLRSRDQKIIGVLQAINRREGEFTNKDLPVFQSLADHLALAIERTRELQAIRNELEERDMMLTEVHHRLKNNLSTITALIELELPDVADEKSKRVLQKTMARIKSMTEVHDFLCNHKPGNEIKLKFYIKQLAKKIANILSYPDKKVAIAVHADDIYLDTDRAMTCGLLLNELMVNCYKHAFDEKTENPTITIELEEHEGQYILLKVSDNGTGIGENFSISESRSVGGWLIDALIRRLEAEINIEQNGGTTFKIRFER